MMRASRTIADRDHVHEAVVVEAAVEDDVAAEVRHAERVAVLPDALDDAARDLARPLRRFGPAGSPKRSASSTPITSAPMQ